MNSREDREKTKCEQITSQSLRQLQTREDNSDAGIEKSSKHTKLIIDNGSPVAKSTTDSKKQ